MAAAASLPGRDEIDRYRARRERLLAERADAVFVLPSAPELLRSRDTPVRYRPDSNLHYLTGFTEPGAVAVLTPFDDAHRLTLFVRPRDAEREVWDGRRLGVDGAREHFGADAAYPVAELDERLPKLLEPAARVVYALGHDAAMDRRVLDRVVAFRQGRQRTGRGPIAVEDPDLSVGQHRLMKDDAELALLREAARISALGHEAAIGAAAPGVGEWELEAVLEATFRAAGSAGPAYRSIVGAGVNATTLHHVANDGRARPGDLVLIDAGAEYRMYAGDITRTFPVSGRFSPARRAVYDVVLAAEQAAIDAVRPGAGVTAVHDAAVRSITEGLVQLGLLRGDVDAIVEANGYKRFFMHQTSHWLGLDVHDVGLYASAGRPVALEPGMVLTVEPGLYIAADADDVPAEFRGIGVRIEDDVVVTADGAEILTRGVPVEPDAVERLVGSRTAALRELRGSA
jgi:Xaa-Pro aminopeptidase